MSIQQIPEKEVTTLRKRLYQAIDLSAGPIDESMKESELVLKFEAIDLLLQDLENSLLGVKAWEDKLVGHFTEMRLQIYKTLTNAKNKADGSDIKGDLQLVEGKIRELNKVLEPPPDLGRTGQGSQGKSSQSQKDSERKVLQEWKELGVEEIIHESSKMLNFQASYDTLEKLELKLCFLFFSVFPENAEIKKRPLIYWWIGEGLIAATDDKTAEEEGESIFQELIDLQFIEPYHEIPDKPSPDVNACKMHPWLRHLAISLAQKAKLFEFDSSGTPSARSYGCQRECLVLGGENSSADPSRNVENLLTVFNVSEQYLDLNPDWLSKLKKVEVLQLGAWHCSRKHHIEVEKEEVLRGLRALKHLKYLSLRGISLITTIPASIGELLSLEILDLRACHNLEELPSEIESLTRLTHLDVSDCPFIEGMPKELQNLTHLQVLKGFVIGNSKTSCKIDDLANLKELRRLGIVIGNEAVAREGEFTKLKDVEKLHSLTIWWGVKKSRESPRGKPQELSKATSLKLAAMDNLTFPPSLEKLDLRGTPHANPPKELKPGTLQKLKKLYIRGGKLTRLDDGGTDQQWNVEILRLKYLNDFKLNRQQLLEKFPRLGFLDVKCDEGENKQDIVLKSRSEIENYCKEKVVEKNAMPAENHNSEERKSLKKDNLGEEALVNNGKGKEVAFKTEIEQEASTS
ncbi:DISEASE RESISTANCE PROTEIN RP [Salix purpurea]|uniref:DISEASE RESISTANCE PROTEIN RP n=1 Tax=Salix purpurea TaxID=77065 RepID=A0A9Q0ZRH6_SALPP|nr:DISEASE RESISTANCE PROTEIN RP [Salix purpurea]